MEIVKTPSEFGHKDIRIVESEDKHLDIVFGGTGDIYWIYDNQEEFFTEEDPMYDSFAIPAREEGLYAIFEELYDDLINGNIYHPEQIPNFYKIADPNAQEKENQRCIQSNKDIKESQRYKNLVNNGVITYYSDEELKENAEIVRISKREDCILLEFIRQSKKDEQGQTRLPGWYFIRIRLNGSSYTPCDIVFWRHFDNLQNYEPQKAKQADSGLTYKKQKTQE